MIAKDYVPPWARGGFDQYQFVVSWSITSLSRPAKRSGPSIYWVCKDCEYEFAITGGTIMQTVPLPPQEWFHLARNMLLEQKGTRGPFGATPGSFFGIQLTPDQQRLAQTTVSRLIPSATPGPDLSLVPHIHAIKTPATAPQEPPAPSRKT